MGLDAVEFVMELEDEFGIVFSDERVEKWRTIGDCIDAIVLELRTKNRPEDADAQKVEVKVRQVASEMFNTPLERISRSTRLVQDLCMG